jgi:predicted permease
MIEGDKKMSWLKRLFLRISAIIHKKELERDMDEELRIHIEMTVQENIERGMSAVEARREAEKRFGNLVRIKEKCRDVRGGGLTETFFQDLRFGIRMLKKNPGFTLIAVLALSLGIGFNTAIFSVINAVLLRQLPYKNPEQLVIPAATNPSRDIEVSNISYADYLDYKKETEVFAHVAIFYTRNLDISDSGEPLRVKATLVSQEFFDVLGSIPISGRTFHPTEYVPGNADKVIISYKLWQGYFGGDGTVIGKKLRLNGSPHELVGIMPRDAQWPEDANLWLPLALSDDQIKNSLRRDNLIWNSIARLKPGVTPQQATAVMKTISTRIEQEHPESMQGWSSLVVPINEWLVESKFRRALIIIFGAVGFVLLIACVNVANLLMARAATRGREISIRIALGAGRLRLIRQLLTESLLLSLLGGIAGLLLAIFGINFLTAIAPPDLTQLREVNIDIRLFIFVLTISLLTSLLFGLLPALYTTRIDLNESFKEGGRNTSGGVRGARIRNGLVVAEIALSIVLLIGAGLMIKSFYRLQQTSPGLRVEGLLTMSITAPRARYKEDVQQENFYRSVVDNIKTIHGVRTACASSALPLGGGGYYLGRAFLIEGQPEPPASDDFNAAWNIISPEYFRTMGIALAAGREFSASDASKSTPVIIINEALARSMFPDGNAIGKWIRSWRDENILREIVGIVKDTRYFSRADELRGLVYVPYSQDVMSAMTLTVYTEGDPAGFIGQIRNQIWAVDKDIAIADVKTMEKINDESLAPQRFNMLLLTIFAGVAMLLAAVGVYGVMTYSVNQRAHEIGIRIALGASPGDVLKMVLKQGMLLAAIGTIAGILLALAITQVMASLLFETSARDPLTFVGIPFLLSGVALLACYLPARRATRVDPMVALRYG